MKRGIVILIFILHLTLSGCKKDETETVTSMSNEDVIDLLGFSLSNKTMGLAKQINDAVFFLNLAMNENPVCNSYTNSFIQLSNQPGVDYNYDFNLSMTVGCIADSQPEIFIYTYYGDGACSDTIITSQDFLEGEIRLNKILPVDENFTVQGYCKRISTKTQQFKIRNKTTFVSVLRIHSIELTVNKARGIVSNGSVKFDLEGTVKNGNDFLFTGEIVFLDNGNASVTYNGSSYPIQF